MFFNFRALTRYPFLLSSGIIPTFDFSESVSSLFITLISLFLHSSLLCASSIISKHLIIIDSPHFCEYFFMSLSSFLWHYLKAINHLRFSLLSQDSYISGLSLLLNPGPVLRASWYLVTLLLAPSFSPRLKIFCHYIVFQMPTPFLWSHFLLAGHPCNSHGISTMFCLP